MISKDPERLETQRMLYLRGYIIAVIAFMVLWITRFFFRAGEVNSEPIGIVVLIGLIITAIVYSYYMLRLAVLNSQIAKDPEISAALNNEMYQLYSLRAWKPAFIASTGSTLFFALVAFVYPVFDLMFVALTAIIIGACAYLTSLYTMYRSA